MPVSRGFVHQLLPQLAGLRVLFDKILRRRPRTVQNHFLLARLHCSSWAGGIKTVMTSYSMALTMLSTLSKLFDLLNFVPIQMRQATLNIGGRYTWRARQVYHLTVGAEMIKFATPILANAKNRHIMLLNILHFLLPIMLWNDLINAAQRCHNLGAFFIAIDAGFAFC